MRGGQYSVCVLLHRLTVHVLFLVFNAQDKFGYHLFSKFATE